MHNRDVFVLHVVDHNFTNGGFGEDVAVPEEQEVTALEGRLHASGEHDDYRRRRIGDDRKSLPHLYIGKVSNCLSKMGVGNLGRGAP